MHSSYNINGRFIYKIFTLKHTIFIYRLEYSKSYPTLNYTYDIIYVLRCIIKKYTLLISIEHTQLGLFNQIAIQASPSSRTYVLWTRKILLCQSMSFPNYTPFHLQTQTNSLIRSHRTFFHDPESPPVKTKTTHVFFLTAYLLTRYYRRLSFVHHSCFWDTQSNIRIQIDNIPSGISFYTITLFIEYRYKYNSVHFIPQIRNMCP